MSTALFAGPVSASEGSGPPEFTGQLVCADAEDASIVHSERFEGNAGEAQSALQRFRQEACNSTLVYCIGFTKEGKTGTFKDCPYPAP